MMRRGEEMMGRGDELMGLVDTLTSTGEERLGEVWSGTGDQRIMLATHRVRSVLH